MVAFARAKAKSIFSMLRSSTISKLNNETPTRIKADDSSTKQDKRSNYFLEAIKNGGIWLSWYKELTGLLTKKFFHISWLQ